MEVTAQMVKQLRERTGAPMMDCKHALAETQGDFETAIDVLRKRGIAAAAKKAGRATAEGAVGAYIHAGSKIGVLVEVNCETDFVARTDDFQELLRDIAMHIAAADPRFLRREEVTAEVLDRERAIFSEQAAASGKPQNVVERIVEGKIEKYFAEAVLLEQPFVKNPGQTVSEMIGEKVGKLGENIQVSRFVRYKLGEAARSEASPEAQ
jgi:elongation factor Ts